LSTLHTVGKAQNKDAYDKSSSGEAPRSAVSWKSYTLHILITIVIIEGFILAYIYKQSNIGGQYLRVLIGFVSIAFALVVLRLIIDIFVEMKIKVLEKEVNEYIACRKATEVKAIPYSKALQESKQKIKAL
jgi:DMSO reductase anchor subunit